MKTILVPTDFSPEAEIALQAAINLATKFKATICVLHVVEAAGEGSFNVEGEWKASSWEDRLFNMRMIESAKNQIARVEENLAKAGVEFKTILKLGNAFHGITALITEQKADLVVMGTTGTSGTDELLVGSNTEKVVRRAACPVLAVSGKTQASFKNIAWATSLRNEDIVMPPLLKVFIDGFDATVHLVRVNTPGLFIKDSLAKAKLEEVAKALKLKKVTTNVYNDYSQEEGILAFAEAINADLIYMVTSGRTGLAHLLNGSIAEDVVNHSKRPVLTSVRR